MFVRVVSCTKYEFGIVPNSFCERRRDMQVTEAMNHGGHINQTGTYLEFPPITSRHHIRRGVTISLPGKYGNETMTFSTLSLSQVTLRTRDTGYKNKYATKSCLLSLHNQQQLHLEHLRNILRHHVFLINIINPTHRSHVSSCV